MSRKRWVVIGILTAAGVAAAALFAKNKVHFVDVGPAVALTNQYFTDMKAHAPEKAFELYSAEFQQTQVDSWKYLLLKGSDSFGTITDYSITHQNIVPVSGRACVLLRYTVQRTKVSSEEGFVACPQDSGSWVIVGHEFTRTDTGQHISAGVVMHEVGVHFP